MKITYPQFANVLPRALLAGAALLSSSVVAQDNFSLINDYQANDQAVAASFRIAPSSILNEKVPLLSIARNVEQKDFQGAAVKDALNFNLGLQFEPISGLNVSADAWKLQVDEAPAASPNGWRVGQPKLYIENSAINEFNLDNPLLGTNIESKGLDLGASYVWDTNRFGQFTLSSITTYVQEFENNGALLDFAVSDISERDKR